MSVRRACLSGNVTVSRLGTGVQWEECTDKFDKEENTAPEQRYKSL